MEIKKKFYEHQAHTMIKNLKLRQIEGFYCSTSEEAKEKALSFISNGDVIGYGGSMTIDEIGIMSSLRANNQIHFLDRATCNGSGEMKQLYRDTFSSNVYFMSTNAITLNGELVNIDGTGNRVASLIYGPDKVIIIAGMNKVATSVEEAITRVRNVSSPMNCIRLERSTPCAVTGTCANCLSPDCICSDIVITRRSSNPDRIKVILVGEELGY